jgi:hypothetical protein
VVAGDRPGFGDVAAAGLTATFYGIIMNVENVLSGSSDQSPVLGQQSGMHPAAWRQPRAWARERTAQCTSVPQQQQEDATQNTTYSSFSN